MMKSVWKYLECDFSYDINKAKLKIIILVPVKATLNIHTVFTVLS